MQNMSVEQRITEGEFAYKVPYRQAARFADIGVTRRILVKSFEEESSQIQADDMLKLSYLASQLNSGCLAQLNIYDDVKCNRFVRLNMGCAFDYPHEPRELQTRMLQIQNQAGVGIPDIRHQGDHEDMEYRVT